MSGPNRREWLAHLDAFEELQKRVLQLEDAASAPILTPEEVQALTENKRGPGRPRKDA